MFSYITQRGEDPFCERVPGKICRFTTRTLVCTKHLTKTSSLAMRSLGLRAARPGAIPATSPASSAGEWLGRAWGLRGLGLCAHFRRRQDWWPSAAEAGDGGWRSDPGEPAAGLGHPASVGAIGGPSGGRSSTCWRCKWPEGGARRAASPAGRQLCCGSAPVHAGTRRSGLYSLARRRRRFASVQSLQGCGMSEDGRRRARGRRANGVWRWSSPASGSLPRGADHGPACVTHRESPTPHTDRRTLAVLRVHVQRTRR
jgi:hypothetical protein